MDYNYFINYYVSQPRVRYNFLLIFNDVRQRANDAKYYKYYMRVYNLNVMDGM